MQVIDFSKGCENMSSKVTLSPAEVQEKIGMLKSLYKKWSGYSRRKKIIILIIAIPVYFFSPIDLIPDFLALFLGPLAPVVYVDDVAADTTMSITLVYELYMGLLHPVISMIFGKKSKDVVIATK